MAPQTEEAPLPLSGLLARARRKQGATIELTRILVSAESPSDRKPAVDACMLLAVDHAGSFGGRVKLHRQKHFGDILEARFGPRSSRDRVLVLGHVDTVWPLGTLESMPWRIRKGRLWGPGVFDMKAGVAIAFTAIELLLEAQILRREVILLLNSEEEIGSPVSRSIIERVAQECSSVYVLEPAKGLACKTAQKGTGHWKIHVSGVAAHAGLDFEKGASAICELARVIETVSGWTNLERGITVSVGLAGGGTKSNVVPAEAWAEVDGRIARTADGPRLARRFAELEAVDKRCSLTVSGGITRPPMERSCGVVALYTRARAVAAELGFTLDESASGGACDGNFTAALGIPTLNGLGAVGDGAHAAHESVLIEHLAPRTALLAGLLA
jgi:glutamate carboxypeptidase